MRSHWNTLWFLLTSVAVHRLRVNRMTGGGRSLETGGGVLVYEPMTGDTHSSTSKRITLHHLLTCGVMTFSQSHKKSLETCGYKSMPFHLSSCCSHSLLKPARHVWSNMSALLWQACLLLCWCPSPATLKLRAETYVPTARNGRTRATEHTLSIRPDGPRTVYVKSHLVSSGGAGNCCNLAWGRSGSTYLGLGFVCFITEGRWSMYPTPALPDLWNNHTQMWSTGLVPKMCDDWGRTAGVWQRLKACLCMYVETKPVLCYYARRKAVLKQSESALCRRTEAWPNKSGDLNAHLNQHVHLPF